MLLFLSLAGNGLFEFFGGDDVMNLLSGSIQIASWALLFCCCHAALDGLYLNFGTI